MVRGFDPDAVDIRAAAARLAGRPCLFVCNSGDRRMPSDSLAVNGSNGSWPRSPSTPREDAGPAAPGWG